MESKGHLKKTDAKQTGCMVCGKKLIYIKNTRITAKCAYCGKEESTDVFCARGHFVCDSCHKGDILEAVEELCAKSRHTDPRVLLSEVFALPGLNMHGPEYHSVVPAVLAAAYINSTGDSDKGKIKEAIDRGRDIKGGMCGSHGACGAGIGTGIAYSVIHGATPNSKEARGEANRMTALALLEIGKYGGPRCCKRESMLAVESAVGNFGVYVLNKSNWVRYVCGQYMKNSTCIGDKCPYYPKSGISGV